MADQFDRAQDLDARFRNMALDLQARAAKAGSGASRTTCIDCNEIIPLARREAAPGCQRCLSCAEKFERGERK